MREPGDILLVSCYELGHQPLGGGLAARASSSAPGFGRALLDVAVEPLDARSGRAARGSSPSRCRCTPPCASGCGWPRASARSTRRAHLLLRPLRRRSTPTTSSPHGADCVHRRRVRGAAGRAGRARSSAASEAAAGVARRAAGAPHLQRLDFPVPSRAGAAAARAATRACRAATGAWTLAGYVGGEPRLPAPVPALPDPAGLRRALLRRAARRSCWPTCARRSRRAPATSPSATPTSSTGPATRSRSRARCTPSSRRDLRLHRQGRAHAAPPRAPARAGARLGCLFMVSRRRVAQRHGARASWTRATRAPTSSTRSRSRAPPASRCAPTWVPFTPWTTLDDYLELLDFIEAHGLIDHVDPVQYAIRLLVPPGSLLLEHPRRCAAPGPARAGHALATAGRTPTRAWTACRRRPRELVARAVEMKADAPAIFDRVRAMARGGGRRAGAGAGGRRHGQGPQGPPRLTEAWFC